MKCNLLLLPIMAGLTFCAPNASAKSGNPDAVSGAIKTVNFIENKGQITDQNHVYRSDIDFKLSSQKGISIFIGNSTIQYQWAAPLTKPSVNSTSTAIKMYRMDVNLIGANPHATIIADQEQSFYEKYYTSNTGNNGATAHSFRKITYKNIYPHIDWTLYIQGNQTFKYDFIVHPGGKVSDIQLQYGGATALALQQDGSLRATTPMGSIDEQAPLCYTQEGKTVGSRYLLKSNRLRFDVDDYSGTLTIDPSVQWGTYFGGLGNDQGSAIATDTSGHIYMAGGTLSIGNIATNGSYQFTYGGTGTGSYIMGDAFLAKFSEAGNCLWATYYGGSLEDRGISVAIDKTSGSVYLAGSTKSTTTIASTGAHQTSLGGNFDAFLVKFDSTGQRIWGTYYGGSSIEGNSYSTIGATCDGNGNVFLCGETNSNNNISTTGCYKPTKSSGNDAFVVKFNSSGVRQWGTYVGGNDVDKAVRIVSDSTGNIYFGGTTQSSSGLSTTGSYQSSYGGGNDGFIASLTGAGAMQWVSYFGGSNFDEITAIVINPNGKLLVGGNTFSTSGIATTGSFQDTLNGDETLHGDGFLASFELNGTPNWVTYYGGEKDDNISSLYASNDGNIYVGGASNSATGIASTDGINPIINSSSIDAFLAKFNTGGQRQWASYFGGTDNDQGLAVSGIGRKVLYAGYTNSSSSIATANGYQPSFGGGDNDAFLLNINFCDVPAIPISIIGDTDVCAAQMYSYHTDSIAGTTSYNWIAPADWSGNSTTSQIQLTFGSQSGTLYVSALNSCGSSDTVALPVNVHALPQPVVNANGNLLGVTASFATYQWNYQGLPIAGAASSTYTATNSGYYSVTVTNSFGCAGTSDSVSATVTALHDVNASNGTIFWYPNPASDILNVLYDKEFRLVVYNTEGRLVMQGEGTTKWDVSELVDGIYLIRLTDRKGSLLKEGKFIKVSR